MNNFIYETPTKVYFGKDEELKVGKIIAEFHPKKVLVHFCGNSARKRGLTQCGREFQLVVHQLEHEVSGMYPEVAHGAGLAALWCSWARYVYKANINRWLQYASNVWGLDIDFEHPEKTIETAIDMQEQYYASIGMPIGLKELGVKEDDLAKLALDCSRNKTRSLIGYKPLAYEDILVIYQMAYERG